MRPGAQKTTEKEKCVCRGEEGLAMDFTPQKSSQLAPGYSRRPGSAPTGASLPGARPLGSRNHAGPTRPSPGHWDPGAPEAGLLGAGVGRLGKIRGEGQTINLLLQEVQEELLALLRHLVADFLVLAAGARLRCRREVHHCSGLRGRHTPMQEELLAGSCDFARAAAAAATPPPRPKRGGARDFRAKSAQRAQLLSQPRPQSGDFAPDAETWRKTASCLCACAVLSGPGKFGFRRKFKGRIFGCFFKCSSNHYTGIEQQA